jgi:glycine/D-amino acid oxidase-like deaminating enzyme
MPSVSDVIIVGGGINGACIAFNLAKRGVKVTLVEKTFIAGGPTGRSSAIIRQHYSNQVTAGMALRSLRVFQNFGDVVGGQCDFVQTGFLLGAREQDVEALEANVALEQSVGINTRVIAADEIKELEPHISLEGIVAAAYEPESGYADPAATTNAFAQRAKQLGAELVLGTRAVSVEIHNGRVTGITTDKGHLSAGAVVVAAGPWSAPLVNPTGIELPVEASRHQVCLYQWPAGFHSRAIYADFVGCIYMRPETGSQTLVGSIEPEEGDDKVADPDHFGEGVGFDTVTRFAERIALRYPAMEDGGYTSGYSSLYDITPDWHSIMDELPSAAGLYCMAGSSGHGFKLGPAVGEMMADLILDGKQPGDDIDLFSYQRFAEGRLVSGEYEYGILG